MAAHLARVYQAAGRRDDAIEMYLAPLNATPPDRISGDDAKDTGQRLSELLGGFSQVDDRLAESRKKKSQLRVVSIANPSGAQGIMQYTVIIDANSKIVDLATAGADDSLVSFTDAMRAVPMPQSFPGYDAEEISSPGHPRLRRRRPTLHVHLATS
jgi:hypothetical protein